MTRQNTRKAERKIASPRFLSTLSRVLPRHSMFPNLNRNSLGELSNTSHGIFEAERVNIK